MLARGDIVAARLFYERAAALGSAEAATSIGKTYDPAFLVSIGAAGTVTSIGKTYDPAFLVSIGAAGTVANPVLAASWYRNAAELGDPEAARRLATMTAGR
jgi:TPR repeat protein